MQRGRADINDINSAESLKHGNGYPPLICVFITEEKGSPRGTP